MNFVKAGWILSLTFVASLLVLAFISPQKSCFQSRLLRSIKIVESDKNPIQEQIVFNCRVQQNWRSESVLAPEYILFVKTIEKEAASTEFFLQKIGMMATRIQLIVSKDRPMMFQIKGNQLFLGWELAKDLQSFQTAMIRAWLEDVRGFRSGSLVYRQAIAQIISALKSGNFQIQSPSAWRPRAWHEALLNLHSYCGLEKIAYPDHLEFCRSLGKIFSPEISDGLQELNDLSLAHYLSDTWLNAFKKLSFQEQSLALGGLSQTIDYLIGKEIDGSSMSLDEKLQSMVRQFLVGIYESKGAAGSRNLDERYQRNFLSHIYQELKQTGYDQNLRTPQIDFLYKTSGTLRFEQGGLLSRLKSSIQQRTQRIQGAAAYPSPPSVQLQYAAIVDDEGFWLPPYAQSLPRGIFSEVSANLLIIKICEGLRGEELMRMSNLSAKVLFIRECDANTHPDLLPLFDGGIPAFVKSNPRFSLVLVNSMQLSAFAGDVEKVKDLFEVLSRRKTDDPLFASLNWRSLIWDPYKQVYEPESDHPLIEMFR